MSFALYFELSQHVFWQDIPWRQNKLRRLSTVGYHDIYEGRCDYLGGPFSFEVIFMVANSLLTFTRNGNTFRLLS